MLARSGWRFFRRHPWQLALAMAGVALGVGVVSGVDLAGSAANRAFDYSIEAVAGRATHQIQPRGEGIDESLFARLRLDLGIREAAPVVEGRIIVSGTSAGTERPMTLLGVDPYSEAPFRDYVGLVGDGDIDLTAFMTRSGAVLLTRDNASRLGVKAGSHLAAISGGEAVQLEVVGTIEPDPASRSVMEDYLLADIATAQELLGLEGLLSRIDLIIDPAEVPAVQELLADQGTVVETMARSAAMRDMTRSFRVNLLALSLLALLVGAFLIYSTMSFLVVQRRGVIGTLRTMGVSRRELFVAVLKEALLVGIPGTGLGLVVGTLLGHGLTDLVARTIDDLYFR